MKRTVSIPLLIIMTCLALSGCASKSGAAAAIETYIKALVGKDANALKNASCAQWEGDAQVELDSFTSVSITLDGLSCQETGKDGNTTLVSCSGKITASYNGENQELDLSSRTYRAVQEGGDWRMCGYQ
jgi:predicted small secreted protein